MGYGGIVKSVFKIAATALGAWACGPPCAAIGSAVATGATGGSFKDALMAGATTFATASFSQALSGSISGTGAGAADALQASEFASIGGGTIADAGLGPLDLAALSLNETPISDIPIVGDVSEFIESGFGKIGDTTRTGFDLFQSEATKTLQDLGFESAVPTPLDTAGDLLAAGTGGLLDMTLSQALNSDLPEVDAILAQKWNPEQILALRTEARNALSQDAFERLTGDDSELENPFFRNDQLVPDVEQAVADEQRQASIDEFLATIARGIENQNVSLGDATRNDVLAAFDNPNFGQNILNEEEAARINTFGQNINDTFTGDAFTALDDDIIDSIISERQGPAQAQISKFQARGNLNATGGQTANEFIQNQIPQAQERVRELGSSVLGGNQRDVNTIRDTARQTAGEFQLGDDLFDIAPFQEQRTNLIGEREGTLGTDVRTAIGSEPLFNVTGALQSAGRAQGVVSGQGGNQNFLDSIAARELGSTSSRNNRRGLGSRGSGAF